MSDDTRRLPPDPSLRQLRKQAKEHLVSLRLDDPTAKLAEAQRLLARGYGFRSWNELVTHCRASEAC